MPRGVPGSLSPHGTLTRYFSQQCRCDVCRKAARLYHRKLRGQRPREVYNAERAARVRTRRAQAERRERARQKRRERLRWKLEARTDDRGAKTEALVGAARKAGMKWDEIGEVFGVTKQAVQQRFGPRLTSPV